MSGLAVSKSDLLAASKHVSLGWHWRDRNGGMHAPADMSTRHLFFTLRMIWNNVVPEDARVGDVRLYRFWSFYTVEYMAQAVTRICAELRGRDDLRPEWRGQLLHMLHHFAESAEVRDARLRESTLAIAQRWGLTDV